MDKIDWEILDSLADDYESINQIYPPLKKIYKLNIMEAKERIIHLLNEGYIFLMNDEMDSDKFREETDSEYSDFWFGLTSKGADYWQETANEYGEEKVNWANHYVVRLDFTQGMGYICSQSKERCIKGLNNCREQYLVDEASIIWSEVDKFKAKYYKELENGIKVTFRFKKEVN